MLTITHQGARRLRAVFRRRALGSNHKGAIPPLILHAEVAQLRAQYQYRDLAIEYVEPIAPHQRDSIPTPLEALADVEGRDDSPVTLETVESDRIVARWLDRGIPRTREYPVLPFGKLAPFPDSPAGWAEMPADLLKALAEASETCAGESGRYAMDCIQVRADSGEVIATDGGQLLIRSGFAFPWEGDLLIPASPVFASKGLRRHRRQSRLLNETLRSLRQLKLTEGVE